MHNQTNAKYFGRLFLRNSISMNNDIQCRALNLYNWQVLNPFAFSHTVAVFLVTVQGKKSGIEANRTKAKHCERVPLFTGINLKEIEQLTKTVRCAKRCTALRPTTFL
jgi:hypothetical protein